jgi:hypothetical protein
MRKWILLAALTAGLFSLTSLSPNRAEAMAIGTPAGMAAAIDGSSLAQDVAYICRRVWRCGPYGCGWRRICGWRGGYGWYGGPGWRRGWYGRGWYGRPGWRRGYWRRW